MNPRSAVLAMLLMFNLNTHTNAQAPATPPQPASEARELSVTVGKSVVMDSPVNVQRVSVANGDLAEAIVVSPREVVVNGKTPGETTLIVWQQSGNRLLFDLTVVASPDRVAETRITEIRRQLDRELKGQNIEFSLSGDTVFITGTASDIASAQRAEKIIATLGKPVNLLNVTVPSVDPQILLKVRFANVDRAASLELGANIVSTGAGNTQGRVTTGQFSPPTQASAGGGQQQTVTLQDALNVFLFRPDINLLATIKALQNKRLLEILAEPNVLAINNKQASFLAGGEFPYPTLQGGGGGLGAVTIQFREFGIRLNFLPKITPRGTIRLQVTPEVSSLDYANGLVFQGFTIPGLSTRRVQTEIELEQGQSFAIGGLLDNRVTDIWNKIPGLGDIPLLGKIFQSKQSLKSNSELLVLVTPELVRPIPADQKPPEIGMPIEFLKGAPQVYPRTPGMSVTGPVPVTPKQKTIPLEQLIESEKAPAQAAPGMQQFTPIQFAPVAVTPAPAAPAAAPPVTTPAAKPN